MPYPQKYARGYGFQGYQDTHPEDPLPGDQVDVELDGAAASSAAIVEFLKIALRPEGVLQNELVGVDQATPELLNYMATQSAPDRIAAAASATAAASSASSASGSATAAAGSATSASGSVTSAAASASAASTSATAAAASAALAALLAAGSPPRFRVYRGTSNQTALASGVATTIAFNAATYNASTIVNLSTGVATIPVAGSWHFDAAAVFSGALNSTAFAAISFFKNGVIYSTREVLVGNTAVGAIDVSADIDCAVGDTITVRIAITTTSSTASVNFAASGADTWFNGRWCGA